MLSASLEPATEEAKEQRSGCRFPIRAGLRYQVFKDGSVIKSGIGQSINLSSTGILFDSLDELAAGWHVQLTIDWPARIDNRIALTFHVLGQIVRVSGRLTAATIVKHEFRICPANSRAAAAPETRKRSGPLPVRTVSAAD